MKNTLKNIIETFQNASILEIRNQEFFNEILFENIFSAAIFAEVNLSNCEILDCEISKTEFTEHIFKNCQFKQVDFGWSHFMDCEFLETRLDDINFEAAILSNLEIKDLTVLNLNFTDTFPTKFYKSNSNEGIEVKSQSNFANILKDMNLISTDEGYS